MSDDQIRQVIEEMLAGPVFFRDVLARLEGESYRAVLRAWAAIREARELGRDEFGRYMFAHR